MSSSRRDPRRNPKKKSRIDRTTIILSIIAGVLLVLVILFLDRRTVGALFPVRTAGMTDDGAGPVIERVVNDSIQTTAADPVVELGVPEQPEESIAETGSTESAESGAAGETTARLFFVRVSDEGKISIKGVLRPVPASGSPLTTSIRSLIDGPRPGELSNDVLSLIPEGSELIGARIEGGVAFLDFNEQFRFNALGIEGYSAQVEQIVFTATEFSTVDKVQ
ncbi:MAG: GerMN domain-containing protein, partial [Spirochaetaceae bacterium]|nr:GerMN domain-containing protein [Spirochaetaceae bacterium]